MIPYGEPQRLPASLPGRELFVLIPIFDRHHYRFLKESLTYNSWVTPMANRFILNLLTHVSGSLTHIRIILILLSIHTESPRDPHSTRIPRDPDRDPPGPPGERGRDPPFLYSPGRITRTLVREKSQISIQGGSDSDPGPWETQVDTRVNPGCKSLRIREELIPPWL